jgi:predicted transcriptional regulator
VAETIDDDDSLNKDADDVSTQDRWFTCHAASLREASNLMAEHRKAALVVEVGQLVGIFGFKDMMTRAVTKQLHLDLMEVRSLMTSNPEYVSQDMTALEALQTLQDNPFLTQPICIVGLVSVMDVIYGCSGGGRLASCVQQCDGIC